MVKAAKFFREQSGYFEVQSTRPQTIGYALADSPVAQVAWMYEKFSEGIQHEGDAAAIVSTDKTLDDISLYWPTNSGAASAKLYWELRRSMPASPPPPIELPTADSGFAGETILASRRWLDQRFTRLVLYNLVDVGGHFAAWEQPALFVSEMRSMICAVKAAVG